MKLTGIYFKTILLTLGLCLVTAVTASPIITLHDWDVDHAWDKDGGIDQALQDSGYLDGRLQAGGSIMDGTWAGRVYSTSFELYAGTWETAPLFKFDFWADDILPGYIQVRWGYTGSSREWKNTVFDSNDTSIAVGDTVTLSSAYFAWWNSWGGGGVGTSNEFISDLANIDWVGVYIWRGGDGTAAENFGIDNFALWVPEPPEYFLMLSAMLSSMLSLRRKKKFKFAFIAYIQNFFK